MRRARLKWSRLWRHFWDRGDSRRERDRLAVEVEQEGDCSSSHEKGRIRHMSLYSVRTLTLSREEWMYQQKMIKSGTVYEWMATVVSGSGTCSG